MRVAVVAECFLPERNGVTNSVLKVVEHLERSGHEAVVLAPGIGPSLHSRTRVERVPAVPLPVYRSLPVGLPTPRVGAILEGFRPDVVHLAAPAVLGAEAARWAQRSGVPSVAVFQTDFAGFAERYGAGFAAPTIWRALRWVHGHATLTLAPSTSAAWELRRRGIGPVAIWGRGVDTALFDPIRRDESLRRSMAPRGETVVGYVGRLATEKQVERLACLTGAPGIRLVVVGDGPRRRQLQRDLPGALFTGFQSGEQLATTVASLDVFVHTGVHETFCQAVQEALASGVPVVAPSAGGPLDLVHHGDNGWLYPPERSDLMAAAVVDLAGDPEGRARMGRRGRLSVGGRTWAALGEELVGHYTRVAHRARRAPRAA